ncbi:unnamed protein product, partial [Cyprideis torosa]
MHVVIIGAGIIGITTAVRIKQRWPSGLVTIFADKFSPDLTSDGAAGLFTPGFMDETPPEKLRIWSQVSHDYLLSIWKKGESERTGVSLVLVHELFRHPVPLPAWKDAVFGFREMSEEEVRFYHEEHVYGWEFVTFTCESTRMISYYLEKWPDIKIFKRKIDSLDEITNAIGKNPPIDAIVNCAGLGARDIVNDRNLVPIRGQLVKVTAPWIQKALLLDEYPDQPQRCTYVIP